MAVACMDMSRKLVTFYTLLVCLFIRTITSGSGACDSGASCGKFSPPESSNINGYEHVTVRKTFLTHILNEQIY